MLRGVIGKDAAARLVGHCGLDVQPGISHGFSLARAMEVRERLVALGAARGQIETAGAGGRAPLVLARGRAGEANGRVEVRNDSVPHKDPAS